MPSFGKTCRKTPDRGRQKVLSTSCFSEGWEQKAVLGWKCSPGTLAGAGTGARQLELPAGPLQYLPTICSLSAWVLGILQRTLHFREQQLEEILNHKRNKFSFCKEMDTCPISCPTSAFCFYKSVQGGIFLMQYLKHTLAFNHSFYVAILIILMHLWATWKTLLMSTKMQTKNTKLSPSYYWCGWSALVLLCTTQHELFLLFCFFSGESQEPSYHLLNVTIPRLIIYTDE